MTWTPDTVEALAKELRELIEKHKAIPEQCHAERFSSIHKIGSHIIRLNPHSALTWALEQIKEVETERDTYRDMDRQSTERNRELIDERDAANARAGAAEEMLRQIGDYAHDKSTGPVVPDALWEIREMAYGTIMEAGK